MNGDIKVKTYTRSVPTHYNKRAGIIDVYPDSNGLAKIIVDRKVLPIRVHLPEKTSIVQDFTANLREILR